MNNTIKDLLLSENKDDNKLGLILANKTCKNPGKEISKMINTFWSEENNIMGNKFWTLVTYYYNYKEIRDKYKYNILKTPEEL